MLFISVVLENWEKYDSMKNTSKPFPEDTATVFAISPKFLVNLKGSVYLLPHIRDYLAKKAGEAPPERNTRSKSAGEDSFPSVGTC